MSFPKLRGSAGGSSNPFIREILDSFPQVRYFLMYGQAEATARLSYLPPERLSDKLGSIGQGLPSTRLEVLKADGSPVAPGSDETGEIVATGDNAPGYGTTPDAGTSEMASCTPATLPASIQTASSTSSSGNAT